MTTILITCVGSGVGQSVVDSLHLVGDYNILGCDATRNIYAISKCDEFVYMPFEIPRSEYADYVLDLCITHKVDVLIPGHDFELALYSQNIDKFTEKGIQLIVSEPNLIKISRNKKEWYDYFSTRGCNIVPTYWVRDFIKAPDASILPAIVKPADGSASQGIKILNHIEDLSKITEEDKGKIIQPYLFPIEADENYEDIKARVKKGGFLQKSEISIQLIFNSKAKFSGIFISKNTLKNGVPVYVDTIDPKQFKYLDEILKFVPVLEENRVKGPVNIQGRITEKGLFFFEMNMRFTGITGTRGVLGFNEVDYLVKDYLGVNQENNKLEKYAFNKCGVRQVACTTLPKQEFKTSESTVTIYGAGSTIGRYFLKNIGNKYKTVNIIVREDSKKKYDTFFEGTQFNIVGQDEESLQQVLCKTDIFINLASALAFEEDEKKYDAIRNIYALIPQIKKAKIPVVINISSQSVYPQNINIAKDEGHSTRLDSSYSFQKLIIEDFFSSINISYPFSKVVSLRLPRVISPSNIKHCGFFGKMIQKFKEGEKITIPNPNNNTNIIHTLDVVHAIDFIIDNSKSISSKVLNVSGTNLSLKEYCEFIKENIDGSGEFEYLDNSEVETSSMVNGEKLERLGWKPKYSVSEIIRNIGAEI